MLFSENSLSKVITEKQRRGDVFNIKLSHSFYIVKFHNFIAVKTAFYCLNCSMTVVFVASLFSQHSPSSFAV